MRTQLCVNARCVKNEQKLFAKVREQILFINQLVLLNSCHTGSLVVWVVSARMTHGSVADDAVSSESNLTSGEVIFSPCSTGQFLMMLFLLFYQCMLVLYDWCSFFAVFFFQTLG